MLLRFQSEHGSPIYINPDRVVGIIGAPKPPPSDPAVAVEPPPPCEPGVIPKTAPKPVCTVLVTDHGQLRIAGYAEDVALEMEQDQIQATMERLKTIADFAEKTISDITRRNSAAACPVVYKEGSPTQTQGGIHNNPAFQENSLHTATPEGRDRQPQASGGLTLNQQADLVMGGTSPAAPPGPMTDAERARLN